MAGRDVAGAAAVGMVGPGWGPLRARGGGAMPCRWQTARALGEATWAPRARGCGEGRSQKPGGSRRPRRVLSWQGGGFRGRAGSDPRRDGADPANWGGDVAPGAPGQCRRLGFTARLAEAEDQGGLRSAAGRGGSSRWRREAGAGSGGCLWGRIGVTPAPLGRAPPPSCSPGAGAGAGAGVTEATRGERRDGVTPRSDVILIGSSSIGKSVYDKT